MQNSNNQGKAKLLKDRKDIGGPFHRGGSKGAKARASKALKRRVEKAKRQAAKKELRGF